MERSKTPDSPVSIRVKVMDWCAAQKACYFPSPSMLEASKIGVCSLWDTFALWLYIRDRCK
jgi:hypothetical protein